MRYQQWQRRNGGESSGCTTKWVKAKHEKKRIISRFLVIKKTKHLQLLHDTAVQRYILLPSQHKEQSFNVVTQLLDKQRNRLQITEYGT